MIAKYLKATLAEESRNHIQYFRIHVQIVLPSMMYGSYAMNDNSAEYYAISLMYKSEYIIDSMDKSANFGKDHR